jgi:hypothetical protein
MDIPQVRPDAVALTSDVDSLYLNILTGPALHQVVRKMNNAAPELQLVVHVSRIQLVYNHYILPSRIVPFTRFAACPSATLGHW